MGQAKDALDALGVSAYDASGKAKPLEDVLLEIKGKLEGLDAPQRNQIATLISGGEAMASFSSLIRAAGGQLGEFETLVKKANGETDALAKQMDTGLAKAWQGLTNEVSISL